MHSLQTTIRVNGTSETNLRQIGQAQVESMTGTWHYRGLTESKQQQVVALQQTLAEDIFSRNSI
jgi:hypothetical protein